MGHPWTAPLSPEADVHTWYERQAQKEHDLPLRSALGSGCCLTCGRPLPGDVWRNGDCLGVDCNVDWAEYDERVSAVKVAA